MAKDPVKTTIDVRKSASSIRVIVKTKNVRKFKAGLWFIRFGCWLSGLKFGTDVKLQKEESSILAAHGYEKFEDW